MMANQIHAWIKVEIMKNRRQGLAALALSVFSLAVSAQPAEPSWSALQQAHFPGKQLEAAPFIHLTAPSRAPSGEQVPFAFSIDHPMTANRYIKSVTLFVDANPEPLTAVFHFNPQSGKAELSTRIRFESDSPVHVVAESSVVRSVPDASYRRSSLSRLLT